MPYNANLYKKNSLKISNVLIVFCSFSKMMTIIFTSHFVRLRLNLNLSPFFSYIFYFYKYVVSIYLRKWESPNGVYIVW